MRKCAIVNLIEFSLTRWATKPCVRARVCVFSLRYVGTNEGEVMCNGSGHHGKNLSVPYGPATVRRNGIGSGSCCCCETSDL